jgi:TonB-dependent starch-binding outer membrane protein SusC
MSKCYLGSWAACCCLALFLSSFTVAQAQVSGKITSKEDNSPLPGVNVIVKGTSTGTTTGIEGEFTLNAASSDVLVFSFIGFKTVEVPVGTQTTINIAMESDAETLSEIVVTGYSSQQKKDITGAVSVVDSKKLLAVPTSSLGQALQGRVAGVTVGNDNSPGGGVMVRVRGFGTINDNSPLYVVDGVPTKGSLTSLNMNDVASVQVLKDASASSIYGSRAGNGVVIITTKRGKSGKSKLTYDAYYGVQKPWRGLDLLGTQDYADLLWESRRNAGAVGTNGNPTHSQFGNGATPVIPDYIFPAGAMEGDPRVNPANYSQDVDAPAFRSSRWLITKANKQGTDWFDEIFDPAPIQNHQVGLSGGNENGNYAISLNYFDQKGIMLHTNYKRYTLRSNTEFSVSKRFRVGENFQVAYDQRVGQQNGNQSESNAISFAYRMQPIIPVYDIMGYPAGTKGGDLDNSRNPVGQLQRNKDDLNKNVRLFGNAYAEFDILEGLTAKTSIGVDYNIFNIRDYTYRELEHSEAAAVNSMTTTNSYDFNWTWYNTLTYTKSFGGHNITLMAGTEAIKAYGETFSAGRSRFAVDDLVNRYLNAGNPGTANNSGGVYMDWRLASEFAKANYSLNSKYLLDLTVRRDRSSRFAAAYRSAIFPSVSAGWRASNEDFMKSITFISDLKLRAGWGQTGNQEIGDYNAYQTFNTDAQTSFYDLAGSSTSSIQGYELFQFANPKARWETTTSLNTGFDMKLLDNKLDFSFDWYTRETTDMLFPVELQTTHGIATNPFQNIGAMRNRGVDIDINYTSTAMQGNIRYSVGGNFGAYRNEVLKTDGNPLTQYFGFTTRIPAMSVTQQGYPIASFFGYVIDGIFQTDAEGAGHATQFGGGVNNRAGQFIFRDTNGRDALGNFTGVPDGRIDASDRTIIGNPHPDFTYALNVSVGYKDFDLTVFAQGVQGNEIFNYVKYWTDFQTFAGNRSRTMLEGSWRPGKTDAVLPQLRSNDVISTNPSTYYVENGSYLRFKNIQLTYTLPKNLISKLGMTSCAIYVQGQNWITMTKYTGLDPEINLRAYGAGNDRHMGVDEGAYPAFKATLMGINASF